MAPKRSYQRDEARVKELFIASLGRHITRSAGRKGWSPTQRRAALQYIHLLVDGEGDLTTLLRVLERSVRTEVERKFATTCWFKADLLKDVQLPGMSQPWFEHRYQNAIASFPDAQTA